MTSYEVERSIQEIWKLFKETDKNFKETEKRFKETDEKFKQTDEKFKQTDKKINALRDLFETQWGKLMEALVEGGVTQKFQERGIEVNEVYQRIKKHLNGQNMEIDILLVDDTTVIVIEVKTTLKVDHVNTFFERLKRFPTFFSRYKNCDIYGAVAALSIDQHADIYAEKNGLFVIKVGGEGLLKIINAPEFNPKTF
nr:hypothetical protein [Desulfobacteraceae bacterium]